MIHPVILCGGSGTRLWPMSRQDHPKQFCRFQGDRSLFQDCLERFRGSAFASPVLMTRAELRFVTAAQSAGTGPGNAAILLEPVMRDTAAAILSAALHLERSGHGSAVMVAAPCDHLVADTAAFHAALFAGRQAAMAGRLVTFGVRPDRPETGFGYLELDPRGAGDGARASSAGPAPVPVSRFVEKPAPDVAESFLRQGNRLWNAGLLMARADALIAAFETHAPEMMEPCRTALSEARDDLGFVRLDTAAYARAPRISIDYAVLEKAGNVVAVPLDCGWSDLGTWEAVWREMARDADGVAASGAVTQIGCRNALLRSEPGGPRLVGVGLDGIVAVAMGDAVLVADKSRAHDLKPVVARLRAERVEQADSFPRVYRPWGRSETVAEGERFRVRKVVVPGGGQMSLQSHAHRAEHWVVVRGVARVTIGDEVRLVGEDQSVRIPPGALHKLENPGEAELKLIEIQTGSYLGEDDIVRHDGGPRP